MNLCGSSQRRALAQASEAVDESGVRHVSCFGFSRIAALQDRKVDAIVDVDIFDLYTQASSVSADVTDSKLVLADHVNLHSCGKPNSIPGTNHDNRVNTVGEDLRGVNGGMFAAVESYGLQVELVSILIVFVITVLVGFPRERFQVLDQVALFLRSQTQAETAIVMVHDIKQRSEASVVIKTALAMSPQAVERRSAVSLVRRPIRLEIIDADFCRQPHSPRPEEIR